MAYNACNGYIDLQERLRPTCSIIHYTLQQWEESYDPVLTGKLCMHVDILIRILECLGTTERTIILLRHALSLLKDISEDESDSEFISYPSVYVQQSMKGGRPKFIISEDKLSRLLDMNFDCPTITRLFGVSLRTVRRRMTEYGFSVKSTYSSISEQELDQLVLQFKQYYPASGYRNMDGILRSHGIKVQQQRLRSCMQRVDPNGATVRWFDMIHPKKYYVQSPLSL